MKLLKNKKFLIITALLLLLALIYVEMAVGIFGSPISGS